MNFPKLPDNVSRGISKVGFALRKASPEITMVLGIGSFVGCVVYACHATKKFEEETAKNREFINDIRNTPVEDGNEDEIAYSDEKSKNKDLTIAYTKYGVDILKLYGPAITLGLSGIALIITSNRIMHSRNAAISAAFATTAQTFEAYRRRVIDRYGEQAEREIRYDIREEEVTETTIDEKTVTKKEKVVHDNGDKYSDFVRIFDELNPNWKKDPYCNLKFLKDTQRFLNDKLLARGYLFLNEAYEALGLQPSSVGQVVGWVYDTSTEPFGDNYVDFGIFDLDNLTAHKFVNGEERAIILDFNVDGVIYDIFPSHARI